MFIGLTIFGRVFSICIGYKTPWFAQVYFITIAEEYRDDNNQVAYAELIFRFWKDSKYKGNL